jgi:hypothetical protein
MRRGAPARRARGRQAVTTVVGDSAIHRCSPADSPRIRTGVEDRCAPGQLLRRRGPSRPPVIAARRGGARARPAPASRPAQIRRRAGPSPGGGRFLPAYASIARSRPADPGSTGRPDRATGAAATDRQPWWSNSRTVIGPDFRSRRRRSARSRHRPGPPGRPGP